MTVNVFVAGRRKSRQMKTLVYGCYNANTCLNDFCSVRETSNFHVAEEHHKGNMKITEPTILEFSKLDTS